MHPRHNIHENIRRLTLMGRSDFMVSRSLQSMSKYNQTMEKLKTQKAVQRLVGDCRFVALAKIQRGVYKEVVLMQPTQSSGEALATLQSFMLDWEHNSRILGVLDLESEPEHAMLEVCPTLVLTGATSRH